MKWKFLGIVAFFYLLQVSGQNKWDSLIIVMNTPDCHMVYFDLYKNRKRINLLDGKSEWYLLVKSKNGVKIEGKRPYVSTFFRLCKEKNEELTLILKRNKEYYEFPLTKLSEIGGVWVYIKRVDKMCINCYWNMKEKFVFWLKGWISLDTLKRDVRIRSYDDFFKISDQELLTSWYQIDPVVYSGVYYTKEEFRKKNHELKLLIENYHKSINKNEKKK